jgi:hypothetical protein
MSGGSLMFASVTRDNVLGNSTWSSVSYSLDAKVSGLSVHGTFYFELQGTTADGKGVTLKVDGNVSKAIPAICFPSYTTSGRCPAGDNSMIPAFFLSTGVITVQIGSNTNEHAPVRLQIEDAALNPWGGPIIINSFSDHIIVVATYTQAITRWDGVQTYGDLAGMLTGGGIPGAGVETPVSGGFSQKISAVENYVLGNETDIGKITLVDMSPKSLDSSGSFSGTSIIPTTGTIDCSPPQFPGTCTETGFNSTGTYNLSGLKDLTIQGTYNVEWPAPSVVFGGTIVGTVDS